MKFDENSDLSTIYLGRKNMTRSDKINAEGRLPISVQGYMVRKLVGGAECQIPLDRVTNKSFISKTYYLKCESLHSLPQFASKTKRIQIGNGQYISVLFVTPIAIDIDGHRFEIFMLVSDIHENVDLI